MRTIKQAWFKTPVRGVTSGGAHPVYIGSGQGWELFTMVECDRGIEIRWIELRGGDRITHVIVVPFSDAQYEVLV